MPAPPNTTSGTAVDITSLPYSVTQTGIHDAGTTYSVWYKFTATVDGTLGLWGFGDLATYRPTTKVRITNPAGAVYQQYQNRPTYFSVTAGLTYYFEVVPNAGNPTPATLTLSLLEHQTQAVPAGSIGINDVTATYPAALLDIDSNYTVLRYVAGIHNGEYGAATLPNGLLLIGGGATGLYLYDASYAFITFAAPAETCYWLTSNNVDTFYAASGWPFTVGNSTVYSLTDAGVLTGDSWVLDQPDVRGIAVSPDESILYYIAQNDVTTNLPVRRWDLNADAVLSNLAAGIDADTYMTSNLICLSDGSVLVGYRNDTAMTQFVRQYSAAGAVVQTFNLTWQTTTGQQDLMARDITDATFWYWQHGDSSINAASTFTQFTVATGAVARTVLGAQYDAGRYAYSETATPLTRFGNPYSCPFWIAQSGAPAPPEGQGLNGPEALAAFAADGTMADYKLVWVRRAPHLADENQRVFYRKFELDLQTGVGLSTGQGSDPKVWLRFSNDGGATWTEYRHLSMGAIGAYTTRAIARQLGSARDRVFEVRCSDPVFTGIAAAYLDLEEGTS